MRENINRPSRRATDAGSAAAAFTARLKGLRRREDTILRFPLSGDNWHMTWAADDRQYVGLCDGYGIFKEKPMYNSRMLSIDGGPMEAEFLDVPAYPEIFRHTPERGPTYYGFGILALDGYIYQFLSDVHGHKGAKLIYSPNNGRSWHNQDGSTPVVWESKEAQSKYSMVFFEEDQNSFVLFSILQMGQNYQNNRDGYVYVYSPNGITDGTMNQLVMFRVPKSRILERRAYEYFAGLLSTGEARWTFDIQARSVVHTFPSGWVGTIPYSWQPSVTYNAPLGLYMMTSWGWDYGAEQNPAISSKPSYLGFWVASKPWGPWTQIHEEEAWLPGHDAQARAYQPQIAPKWIAPDGRSFWLVWSDYQMKDKALLNVAWKEELERIRLRKMTAEDWVQSASLVRQQMPYYAFNAQRVDLIF